MKSVSYKMIYFFGPDGTGKTTHAELISQYLRERGYKTWRTNVKQHHTFSYLLLKLLSHGKHNGQAISYYGFSDGLKQKIKTPWKILEMVSLFPAILYRVLLPLLLGYIVVCDRYVLDTLASLSYFLGDRKLISGMFARLLTSMIPKASILFYMNADTHVILKRKKDEPITAKLIWYYKWTYKTLIKQFKLKTITIDTSTAEVGDVQKMILQQINKQSQQVTV